MRYGWIALGWLAATGIAVSEEIAYPADRGGKLLAEVLRPTPPPTGLPAEPAVLVPRPEPALMSRPQLPLSPIVSGTLRLATMPAGIPIRPRPLPDEMPLSSQATALVVPQRLELPMVAGVRLPGVDVQQPANLLVTWQPKADREPLTDPTTPASVQAALAAIPPPRSGPAPFVRENLPDPFENRSAVRLRAPMAEELMPLGLTPR